MSPRIAEIYSLLPPAFQYTSTRNPIKAFQPLATNTPNEDDQSPPNHPSFITPPLRRPCQRIPAVTQTRLPDNEVRNDNPSNSNSDEDAYMHFHDPELVHQTPIQHVRSSPIPDAPIVHSPDKSTINGKEALAHSNAKHQKSRAKGRQSIQKMQKHQKMNVDL